MQRGGEEVQAIMEVAFQANIIPIEMVIVCKYIGRVLTASDQN